MRKKPRGGKRTGSGRKKITDKKKALTVYVRESRYNNMRELIHKLIVEN